MDTYLVPLETPCVYYDKDFLDPDQANELYQDLWKNTPWEKTAKINRWVSLCHELENDDDNGNDNDKKDDNDKNDDDATATTTQQQQETKNNNNTKDYKYRDAPGASIVGFSDSINLIRQKAEEWYFQKNSSKEEQQRQKVKFNVCLLNFYENGEQRIGWHSDREEIGRDTPIASISLGATRTFMIRSKKDGVRDRASFPMTSGSMVIMENKCQHEYLHSVPKETEVTEGRINLTFRCKTTDTAGEGEHERRDNWMEHIIDGATPAAEGWSLGTTATANTTNSSSSAMLGSNNNLVFGDGVKRRDLPDDHSTIYFLAKTNMGAEGYCAAEMEEVINSSSSSSSSDNKDFWKIVAQPLGMDGYVAACCGSDATSLSSSSVLDATRVALLNLKSAHHLLQYHTHFDLEELVTEEEFPETKLIDGEGLYQYFKKRLVDGSASISSLADLSKGGTFRTTCERIGGPHAFKAPEVEREIGGAMSEYYPCKPKMQDYDVNVRVDVVGNLVIIGTQLNVNDMSKDRHFLKYRNVVTIKANLAYAMVRCGAIQPGMTIADPFCGSGTLLLEALEICDKQLKCIGLDVSRRTVDGARDNAVAEGYGSETCNFICSDARGLRRHLTDNSIDAIISNLPWGIKTGHKTGIADLQTIYEIFLRTAWYALKDGARVVLFVLRGLQLTRIVRKLGGRYRLMSVNVIRTSNNLPCIVVIEKLAADVVRESVKGQLAHLNKYVSFSPELYEAIHMENIED